MNERAGERDRERESLEKEGGGRIQGRGLRVRNEELERYRGQLLKVSR